MPSLNGWWYQALAKFKDKVPFPIENFAILHAKKSAERKVAIREEEMKNKDNNNNDAKVVNRDLDGVAVGEGGGLGAKYTACLAIADRALEDRSLAEEIVAKGFRFCDAVNTVCEKFRPADAVGEHGEVGQSLGKTAKQIAQMLIQDLPKLVQIAPLKDLVKAHLKGGSVGAQAMLELVAVDAYNKVGIKSVTAEFRTEIITECTAAKYQERFLEAANAAM